MTTSLQEGPVILIGYEYRLQLQAEADLFPEGASFAGQVRSAINAATVVAELSTAAGSVLRVDVRTLEIVLASSSTWSVPILNPTGTSASCWKFRWPCR